jgi:hypothetical protein
VGDLQACDKRQFDYRIGRSQKCGRVGLGKPIPSNHGSRSLLPFVFFVIFCGDWDLDMQASAKPEHALLVQAFNFYLGDL